MQNAQNNEYVRGRYGRVSTINPSRCRATVEFEDKDGIVSAELMILQRDTFADKDFLTLKPGTRVFCEFLGNGYETGHIVGAKYDEKNPPPTDDPNRRGTLFEDGAFWFYDREKHIFQFKDSYGSYILFQGGYIIVNPAIQFLVDMDSFPSHELQTHLSSQFD